MLCEKCGLEMKYFQDSSTQGWNCEECGWSLVTSSINAIDTDMTIYSIYINSMGEINNDHLKLIAKLANVSYVEAKMLLQTDKSLLCTSNENLYHGKSHIDGIER